MYWIAGSSLSQEICTTRKHVLHVDTGSEPRPTSWVKVLPKPLRGYAPPSFTYLEVII